MNTDTTENFRRQEVANINSQVQTDDKELERQRLVGIYGADNVYDTNQLTTQFDVLGFGAPYVRVRRKSDGKEGSLEFQHSPRLYFNFEALS